MTEAADDSERRQLTVIFCDLVGSTALSERMDPEDLRHVLRDYQQRCGDVIRHLNGHVAQYLGDGLMAYFGYPAAEEQAPRLAVEAALRVVESVAAVKTDLRLPQGLGVRIGIHTGFVVVGNMGDPDRPERLAVGATPNVAARVQAEADTNSVFVSEATHALVGGYFECQPVGVRQLRGVSRPIALYRVVGRSRASSRLKVAEERGFSRFVGRDRELQSLLESWERRSAGGRAVLVAGEAGVGKSRLVHELRTGIGPTDIVECSASEYQVAQTLFPITQYLERWLGFLPKDNNAERRQRLAARLAEVGQDEAFVEFAALLSIGGDSGQGQHTLPSQKQHLLLIHRLVGFFSALARAGASLFVFEDLHWADPSTKHFLEAWLAHRAQIPALTLATARPGLQLAWAEPAGFEVMNLGRLSREAASSIAKHVAERMGSDASHDLLNQVLDTADGVPLFVEEITKTAVERSRAPTSSSIEPGRRSVPVPATLQDSLMARLDGLGSAKSLVQLTAVIGREVPLSWLDDVSPVGSDVLRRELQRITSAGLMFERDDSEPTYVFSHALIQEAAYQSLVRSRREELHQRVADMLVMRHPDLVTKQPLLIAHHYISAGMTSNAVRYLKDAGQRTLARSAFVEAIDIFNRALSLVPTIPESRDRDALEIELLSSLGLALISTRGYSSTEVEDVYSRARHLCERFGDVPLRVLYGIWAVHLVRADARGVNRVAALFQRLVEKSPERDALLVAHSCLGVRAFYRVNFGEAREHLRAAAEQMDLVDPRAQHSTLVDAHGFEGILSGPLWLAWIEALEGDEIQARRQIQIAHQLAERIGDPYIQCQVCVYSAALHVELRDVESARGLAGRALALSTELELHFWQALGLCVQGWVTIQDGKAGEAVAMIEGGLAILEAVGSLVNRSHFASYLVEACLNASRLEQGLRVANEALAVCREGLGPMYEPELLRLKGVLLMKLGSEEDALEHFRAALAETRLQGVRLLELRAAVSLGQLLQRQDKVAEATNVLETTCRKWADKTIGYDIHVAQKALAVIVGA